MNSAQTKCLERGVVLNDAQVVRFPKEKSAMYENFFDPHYEDA
jgi:hypothetical protein